jgi:hypothetical protein
MTKYNTIEAEIYERGHIMAGPLGFREEFI